MNPDRRHAEPGSEVLRAAIVADEQIRRRQQSRQIA
jgi:hypothetical protein